MLDVESSDLGGLVVVLLFAWPVLFALLGVIVGAFRRDRETLLTWIGPFTFFVLPLFIFGGAFVLNEATDLRYATGLIIAGVASWAASIWIVFGYLVPLWEDQVEREQQKAKREQAEELARQRESDPVYQEREAERQERNRAWEEAWRARLSRRTEPTTPEEQGQRLVEGEVALVKSALSVDPLGDGTIALVVAHGRLPWDLLETLARHEDPRIRWSVAANLTLKPPVRYATGWKPQDADPVRALAIFTQLSSDADHHVLEGVEHNYDRFTTQLKHAFRHARLGLPVLPERPLDGGVA